MTTGWLHSGDSRSATMRSIASGPESAEKAVTTRTGSSRASQRSDPRGRRDRRGARAGLPWHRRLVTKKCPAWMVVSAVMLLMVGICRGWLWWTVLDALPRDIGVNWVKEIAVEPGFPTWLVTSTARDVLYDLDDATIASLEHGKRECPMQPLRLLREPNRSDPGRASSRLA